MGKHKQFKFMSFLNILDEAEVDTICKSLEKWIPIIRKKYTKKQAFQRYKFLKYLDKAEIHTITKIWEKWIPIVRKKYGKKNQTFQSQEFLKFLAWSRNPCNSENMGKVDFHNTGKGRENTKISNLWVS